MKPETINDTEGAARRTAKQFGAAHGSAALNREYMRRCRESIGLTQTEWAAVVGRSTKSVFRYEQGHQNWPEPLVKRIGVLAKAWIEERAREHAVVVGGWAPPNDPSSATGREQQ